MGKKSNNSIFIRLLAIAYLGYSVYKIVDAFLAGGEEAPSVFLLILSIVLLGGGAVWVAYITWRDYKRDQEASAKAAAEAAEAAALEEGEASQDVDPEETEEADEDEPAEE